MKDTNGHICALETLRVSSEYNLGTQRKFYLTFVFLLVAGCFINYCISYGQLDT